MSLRNRVTLGTVAVLLVGLTVLSVALNVLLQNRLSADASSVLATRADTFAAGPGGTRRRTRNSTRNRARKRRYWNCCAPRAKSSQEFSMALRILSWRSRSHTRREWNHE